MVLVSGLLLSIGGRGQNYNAVKGSPYAGAIGVADNPASILATPYPWDITLFSMQVQNATNAVTLKPLSLLSQKRTCRTVSPRRAQRHCQGTPAWYGP